MSSRLAILRNLRVLTLAQIITAGVNLVSTAYLGRYLGPENFGILGFAMALVTYYILIVTLGFHNFGLREIARDHTKATALTDHIFTMRLLLTTASFSLYGIMILLIDEPVLVKTVLLINGGRLIAASLRTQFVFHGYQRMGVIAMRKVATSVAGLICLVLLVHRPEDVIIAAAIAMGTILLNDLWVMAKYVRDYGRVRLRVSADEWRRILRASIPMAMSAFVIGIYYNMDIVMLGFMRSPEETGWYVAAYRIHAAVLIPAGLLHGAFMPALSAAHGNLRVMRHRAKHFARLMVVAGLPLAATCMAFSRDILFVVFGTEFLRADTALGILMVNAALIHVNMSFGSPLLAWDRQLPYMYTVFGAGIVNIILNFVLIPRYGIEGAAIATLASEVIAFGGLAWIYFRTTQQLYAGLLLKAVACTSVAIIIAKLVTAELAGLGSVPIRLGIGVLVVLVVYVIGTMSMRIFTVREILDLVKKRQ